MTAPGAFAPRRAVLPARRDATGGRGRTAFGLGLAMAVCLSALPSGSNIPVLWLLWSALFAGAGALTLLAAPPRPLPPAARPVIASMAALVLYAFAMSNCALLAADICIASPWTMPAAGLAAAVRIAGGLGLMLALCLTLDHMRRPRRLAAVLMLGIALEALVALMMLRGMGDAGLLGPKQSHLGALTGTFANRNSLASMLGIGFLLALAHLIPPAAGPMTSRVTRRLPGPLPLPRPVMAAICLLLALALMLTQSRLGLASLAVASLALVASGGAGARRAGLPLFAALGLGALGYLTLYPDRVASLGTDLGNRLALYRQVIGMIADRPFTGFGADSFAVAFQAYHAAPVTAGFVWDRAHSTLLTLWVEYGLIAGSLPILAGLMLFVRLVAPARRDPAAAAGLATLIFCGLHGLGDFSLEIPANAYLFIAIMAMAATSGTQAQEPTDDIS